MGSLSSQRVALDTSVIRYFHKAKQLAALTAYIPKALVFPKVGKELDDQAASRPTLANHMNWTKWPARKEANLDDAALRAMVRIQDEWRKQDIAKTGKDPGPKAHLGEIETVLAAAAGGAEVAALDDGRGRRLGGEMGIELISSAGIAIRATAEGDMTLAEGWAAFSASVTDAKQDEFKKLVADARPRTPKPTA